MRRTRTVLAGMGLALTMVAATSSSASAAALVKSTFKTSSEGWAWGPDFPTATPATWTGERIRAIDSNATNYTFIWWAPPDKFEGDLRAAYKGKITFDMEWDSTDDLPRAARVRVRLYGDNFATEMQYVIDDHFLATGEAAETFEVPIRAGLWTDPSTAEPIDEATMKGALREIELMVIRIRDTTTDTVDNTFYLDNVKVKPRA